ncbi:transmembrane protein 265-like isoform X2 [Heterodontus francisci]|uniref:transmembrane protein 265-like isoform X2 n=1 Tax=Heterodontus francisci TaxID=7792 RepID=UPI00355BE0FC
MWESSGGSALDLRAGKTDTFPRRTGWAMTEQSARGLAERPGATPGQEETAVWLPQANGSVGEAPALRNGGGQREGARPAEAALDRCFWLSVCSVICGCSCVGIYALVNAVRAGENSRRGDVEEAGRCRRRAMKFSVLSFVACFLSVGFVLGFVTLVSYLIRVAR